MIDLSINPVIFVTQIVSFLLLFAAIKRLMFDPFAEVVEERAKRTTGTRADAEHMSHSAQAAGAEYERRMREVRVSLAGEVDAERTRTEQEERAIVHAAQGEAAQLLADQRTTNQEQAASARADLDARARDLAALLLERIGGRKFA